MNIEITQNKVWIKSIYGGQAGVAECYALVFGEWYIMEICRNIATGKLHSVLCMGSLYATTANTRTNEAIEDEVYNYLNTEVAHSI